VVLISPFGFSPTGEVFNCTLEDVATSTATALRADKLIFLTETAGALDTKARLLSELTVKQAQELMAANGGLPEDVQIYLPCAVKACSQGVKRAHLISRHVDGALLIELFTHHGIGTMVVPESPEVIRDATAEDIPGIVQIIEPLEQQGVLVRRERDKLEREIERFFVIENDGNILGCAALYPFPEESTAELACLAVSPFYRDGGRGERLLAFAEARAAVSGCKSVFVLSTRTTHWFIERGFSEADIARLPGRKQSLYNYERRSKIFTKGL
jgi:amino-acid N-acetyltransferase